MKATENNYQPGEKREIDAEQLLKSVEMQLAAQRRPARASYDSRAVFRIGSLIFIVAATLIALSVLQWMVSGMARQAHSDVPSAEAAGKK